VAQLAALKDVVAGFGRDAGGSTAGDTDPGGAEQAE
jgi:hypothetical protein